VAKLNFIQLKFHFLKNPVNFFFLQSIKI